MFINSAELNLLRFGIRKYQTLFTGIFKRKLPLFDSFKAAIYHSRKDPFKFLTTY